MVTEGMLAGLRVLDLTRFVAGSQSTAFLAAMGADVIKVEIPPGDPYRWQGVERAGGESVLFLSLNSGKRSLAVDFRSLPGRAALEQVLASCDVLMENSRPGSLAPHGLDWPSVHARFPALVYGSISGYGDIGPDAQKGGFDLILQAESGIMSLTGTAESGPVKVGAPLLDVGAGLSCVVGLLAGYIERLRTGTGTLVSASLLEFGLASLGTLLPAVAVSGREPGLLGTHSPLFAPYGGFRTEDGWLVMAGAGSEQLWQRACAALDLADLAADARFADGAARVAHRDELTSCIEAVLTRRPTEHWLGKLEAAGVPAAEVRGLAGVLGWSQVAALGSLQAPAPGHHVVGPPFRLDRTVLAYPGPAPTLGRDTRPVLAELGYPPDEVARLEHAGVVVAT